MKRTVLWAAMTVAAAVLLVCGNVAVQAAHVEGTDALVDSVGPMSAELELQAFADEAADSMLLEQAAQLTAEADAEAEADQLIEQEGEAEAEQEAEEEQPAAMVEMMVARGKKAATKGKAGKAKAGKAAKKAGAKVAGKATKAKKAKKSRKHKKSRRSHSQHGWGISNNPRRRVPQRLPSPRLTGAAATLTRANVRCVLCQFIAQKIKKGLTAESAAGSASLIEAFSFASTAEQMRIQNTVEATAHADATASALPPFFDKGKDAPRRFRHTDVLASRASRARFTQVSAKQPGEATDAARAAYLALYSSVYASFEGLCTSRMPLAYLPYCNDMLKSYRFFAQGLNYNDRAEQICMNGNFCDARSYVRRVTHNAYQREPGDA